MKKVERDLVIESKIKELEQKKADLITERDSIEKSFKTNLRLEFPGSKEAIILRIIQDKSRFIMLAGKIKALENTWVLGVKEVYGESEVDKFPCKIKAYTTGEWLGDIKLLVRKIDIIEELEKIEKAIEDLPKFYTEDKKDDIDFENLMKSLE